MNRILQWLWRRRLDQIGVILSLLCLAMGFVLIQLDEAIDAAVQRSWDAKGEAWKKATERRLDEEVAALRPADVERLLRRAIVEGKRTVTTGGPSGKYTFELPAGNGEIEFSFLADVREIGNSPDVVCGRPLEVEISRFERNEALAKKPSDFLYAFSKDRKVALTLKCPRVITLADGTRRDTGDPAEPANYVGSWEISYRCGDDDARTVRLELTERMRAGGNLHGPIRYPEFGPHPSPSRLGPGVMFVTPGRGEVEIRGIGFGWGDAPPAGYRDVQLKAPLAAGPVNRLAGTTYAGSSPCGSWAAAKLPAVAGAPRP